MLKCEYKEVTSMQKYEIIDDQNDENYGRIRALIDFGRVKKGDIGGKIDNYDNLSQEDNCWVYINAQVRDNAKVYGNAFVSGTATVGDNAKVFDNAWVSGDACVYDDAKVCGDAKVNSNVDE